MPRKPTDAETAIIRERCDIVRTTGMHGWHPQVSEVRGTWAAAIFNRDHKGEIGLDIDDRYCLINLSTGETIKKTVLQSLPGASDDADDRVVVTQRLGPAADGSQILVAGFAGVNVKRLTIYPPSGGSPGANASLDGWFVASLPLEGTGKLTLIVTLKDGTQFAVDQTGRRFSNSD